MVVGEARVAVVPREEEAVIVDPQELTLRDSAALCPLEEDCAASVETPVAPG
eukprot:SAG11_NODE_31661_length_290_cov_0.738220_2_plen_51_part_01